MEKREEASRSRGYDLNQDFPDQNGWFEMATPKERKDFFLGGILYDEATGEGARVFTLRQARKHSQEDLYAIQNYMIMSDKVDILNDGKGAISFSNILQAIDETFPPPTKEDKEKVKQSLQEFKRSHPEFFGEVED